MLTGDHVLPRITPNISYHPQSGPNPLGDFLDSLDKVAAEDVELVLPAHEHRFVGLTGRVDALKAHHHQRFCRGRRRHPGRRRHRLRRRRAHELVALVGPDRRLHAPGGGGRGAGPSLCLTRARHPHYDEPADPAAPIRVRDRRLDGSIGRGKRVIGIEDAGRVRILTLDRPKARNAFDEEHYDLMTEALIAADADPAVAVVVFTGSGTSFCAGTDVVEMASRVGRPGQLQERRARVSRPDRSADRLPQAVHLRSQRARRRHRRDDPRLRRPRADVERSAAALSLHAARCRPRGGEQRAAAAARRPASRDLGADVLGVDSRRTRHSSSGWCGRSARRRS